VWCKKPLRSIFGTGSVQWDFSGKLAEFVWKTGNLADFRSYNVMLKEF